jgi:uncharacterized protein (TIGR02757 family)
MEEITKSYLDKLVATFETPDFIGSDPVQFPHRYTKKQDIEVSGLISSAFAYGQRRKIIENLECIHKTLNKSPHEFVINFDLDRDARFFSGFCYRFTGEADILYLIDSLSQVLKKYDSLEDAFLQGFSLEDKNVKSGLVNFVNLLRSYLPCGVPCSKAFSHLVPSPENGSACKRLNLFLKWMVRKAPVDLGIWNRVPSDKLIIPLDVHVARLSMLWGLTDRKSDDWRKAEEITEKLKQFDPDDPVKYDFAIFGAGVSGLV